MRESKHVKVESYDFPLGFDLEQHVRISTDTRGTRWWSIYVDFWPCNYNLNKDGEEFKAIFEKYKDYIQTLLQLGMKPKHRYLPWDEHSYLHLIVYRQDFKIWYSRVQDLLKDETSFKPYDGGGRWKVLA